MKYDEVIKLAELFENGSDASRHILNNTFRELDNEGLIDVMETSREVLFDNTGDEALTKAVMQLMELVQMEQSNRVVGTFFTKATDKVTSLFKK